MREINFDKCATFSSERLSYRGISLPDSEQLVAWRSQKCIYEVSAQARPITMDEHLIWFDKYLDNPTELRVIITIKESRTDTGVVGGACSDETCVLSYYIGEVLYRGNGFASEAIKRFMVFVHDITGISTFTAHIKNENIASIRCVTSLGFFEKHRESTGLIYEREL